MTGQDVLTGFGELVEVGLEEGRLVQADAEVWLDGLLPRERVGASGRRWFEEGYLSLRAMGWEWREAFCITWLSLGRDDRGGLDSVQEVCDFLGVSRTWFYERKGRYENQPARGMNAWDWWAERMQLARLRGHRLAEVDERTFERATAGDSKAADRELYYKRAGVLRSDTTVAVQVGQHVDVRQMSDEELDALLLDPRLDDEE